MWSCPLFARCLFPALTNQEVTWAIGDVMPVGIVHLFCVLCTYHGFGTNAERMVGHLEKLGAHRPPEGPVHELDYVPSPKEFHEMYSSAGVPLLMKGIMKESRAYQLWTDDYLL